MQAREAGFDDAKDGKRRSFEAYHCLAVSRDHVA
jgi:hypothetical protein